MRRWMARACGTVAVAALLLALSGLGAAAAVSRARATEGSVTLLKHLGGAVHAVFATPSYLLWGRGARLEVYTPDGATPLGDLLLEGVIRDIYVADGRAYVAAGRVSLYVVDLADPAAPALLHHLTLPGFDEEFQALTFATSVVARDGVAYVSLYEGGMWVVDFNQSPPASATFGSYLTDFQLVDHYVLALDAPEANTGFYVWDVISPTAPALLGHVEVGERVAGLAVAGGHVYAALPVPSRLQVRTWDPSQPLSSTVAAELTAFTAGVFDVAVAGSRAYVAAGEGLGLVDVISPTAPQLLDVAPAPVGAGAELAALGDYGYYAAGTAGLYVYQAQAETLTPAQQHGLPGNALAGALLDDWLFVAQDDRGLARLALGDHPADPTPQGNADTGTHTNEVLAVPPYLAVADGQQVRLVDPATLAIVADVTLPDTSLNTRLAAAGSLLFATAGEAGVCAIDLAAQPVQIVACHATESPPLDLAVDGATLTLYVAAGRSGVVVLNVSDPKAILVEGEYTEVEAWVLALDGDQLLVADGQPGGELVSLERRANPNGPVLAAQTRVATRGLVYEIEVAGELVYLAAGDGLQVLRREPGGGFSEWAWYDSGGSAVGVEVNGNLAYLLDSLNGVLVLDVSTPIMEPTQVPIEYKYYFGFFGS